MPCFYLTPKQDDFNKKRRVCLTTARVRSRLLFRSEGGLLLSSAGDGRPVGLCH